MTRKRRVFSPALKAKLTVAAARGDRTTAELAGIVTQPDSETAVFPHNSEQYVSIQTNRRMGRDSNPRYTFA